MTQILTEDGTAVPVTLVHAEPNVVTQNKTDEANGYNAVQLGAGRAKRPAKPQEGHAKKAGLDFTPRIMREVRDLEFDPETIKPGAKVEVTNFEVGDEVDVTGTSKGKGFAGTVKRHNFLTSPKSHGGKGYIRKPGSIGSMYPQKVMKGKRMAGRMGFDKTTIVDLKVVLVDAENNLLGIRGALPGPRKGTVIVRGSK